MTEYHKLLKDLSMKYLEEKGITVMDTLPYIESLEEIKIRSKKEVVDSLLGLLLVSVYAEGLIDEEADIKENQNFIKSLIDRYSAHDCFSQRELEFIYNDDPSRQDVIYFTWQYEPFTVMLWALGFLQTQDALDVPASIADVGSNVKVVQQFKDYDNLYDAATLVDKKTIMEQTDLIYRYNWACVDDRINGRNKLQDAWGIVLERHKSLNWLTHYNNEDNWDYVGTDT